MAMQVVIVVFLMKWAMPRVEFQQKDFHSSGSSVSGISNCPSPTTTTTTNKFQHHSAVIAMKKSLQSQQTDFIAILLCECTSAWTPVDEK